MLKLRVENKFLGRFVRVPLLLLLAALMFGPMAGCYAYARPAGAYYSEGYYGGGYRGPNRYYYPRERHRHYRAPDSYYRGGYRDRGRHHHHHHREHRHHHRGPRW